MRESLATRMQDVILPDPTAQSSPAMGGADLLDYAEQWLTAESSEHWRLVTAAQLQPRTEPWAPFSSSIAQSGRFRPKRFAVWARCLGSL